MIGPFPLDAVYYQPFEASPRETIPNTPRIQSFHRMSITAIPYGFNNQGFETICRQTRCLFIWFGIFLWICIENGVGKPPRRYWGRPKALVLRWEKQSRAASERNGRRWWLWVAEPQILKRNWAGWLCVVVTQPTESLPCWHWTIRERREKRDVKLSD